MVNSKRKGSTFETEAVKILNNLINDSTWKRIPMSGAIGTRLKIPILSGDLIGKVEGFPKEFKIDTKVGYNNSRGDVEVKQLTVKKEWLDKIQEEADGTYSTPFVLCKFDNVKKGCKYFVCIDLEIFSDILNEYTDLKKEMELLYDELGRTKNLESGKKSL